MRTGRTVVVSSRELGRALKEKQQMRRRQWMKWQGGRDAPKQQCQRVLFLLSVGVRQGFETAVILERSRDFCGLNTKGRWCPTQKLDWINACDIMGDVPEPASKEYVGADALSCCWKANARLFTYFLNWILWAAVRYTEYLVLVNL